ncbi:Heat shock 70 kDa protein 1A [Balamuthia mandrillaris]
MALWGGNYMTPDWDTDFDIGDELFGGGWDWDWDRGYGGDRRYKRGRGGRGGGRRGRGWGGGGGAGAGGGAGDLALIEAPRMLRDLGNVSRGFRPFSDVRETDDAIILHAELPGVKKEDIQVGVEGDQLVVRGEKKHEYKDEGDKFHRMERSYGSFTRRMALPTGVDPNAVSANFRNGVLEVNIPKPALTGAQQAKKIDIK